MLSHLLHAFLWLLLLLTALIAVNLYIPLLLLYQTQAFITVLAVTLGIVLWQPQRRMLRIAAVVVLSTAMWQEGWFQYQRYVVLNSDAATRQLLSQHVITGYQQHDEINRLLDKQLVGGVFLIQRNLPADSSLKDLQVLISALRTRSPLLRWIATDQEGGLVQKMSPPLPIQPSLRSVISEAGETWQAAVVDYAQQQGQALAQAGINLNFAPVVDVPLQKVFWEAGSYIPARALGYNVETVTAVAKLYSISLLQAGVLPTLKHFPGLGRVTSDTHFFSATLKTDLITLQKTDWQPFWQISQQAPIAIMLAHVQLAVLDADYPTSFSPAVIKLLREQWRYQGLLITDDVSMFPVYYSPLGVGGAAVQALNSGVDLVLVGYDYRLFYPVMYALLRAYQQEKLDLNQLARSRQRQQIMWNKLQTTHLPSTAH